jgi:hypothetical protein
VIGRVLSIPPKRFQRRAVTFLTAEESQALLDAPPQNRWEGRRDRAMLTSPSRQGCASQSSSRSTAATSPSARAAASGSRVRDASTAQSRSPKKPRQSSPSGSPSEAADHRIRCSRRAQAAGSAATPSNAASRPTPPPRPTDAHRSSANKSTPTSCGTAARWRCCTPGSTAP